MPTLEAAVTRVQLSVWLANKCLDHGTKKEKKIVTAQAHRNAWKTRSCLELYVM